MNIIDYSKTFTYFSTENYNVEIDIVRDELPFIFNLNQNYIQKELLSWCTKNCKSKWGWWFDCDSSYLGFEDSKEKVLFWLSNNIYRGCE